MEKAARSFGDTSTWSAAQPARVPRLIRLSTEVKTNPRQTPEHLYRTLGISRSRYCQDTFTTFVGEGTTIVKVRFSKRIAPYIKESLWHSLQRLIALPDGDLLYEVNVSYPKEVAWWVMSWGSEAEVLEPSELRADVAGEVRKLAAVCGK